MSNVGLDGFMKRALICAVGACLLAGFAVAQTPAPDSASTTPSRDTVKGAKAAGYEVKISKSGTARYCKSEALVGTHFPTKSCINEEQLLQVLAKAQEERAGKNELSTPPSNTGDSRQLTR
jgi:hypothetical protein